ITTVAPGMGMFPDFTRPWMVPMFGDGGVGIVCARTHVISDMLTTKMRCGLLLIFDGLRWMIAGSGVVGCKFLSVGEAW
ncbi:MAG: hypothetical protein WCB53_00200, partial [Terriglobales bacterium]